MTAYAWRLLAAVALMLSMALAAQAAHEPGKPISRWEIKTHLTPGAKVTHAHHVDLGDLIALEDVPGVKAHDARYTTEIIPNGIPGGLHEGDIVQTEGWVHVIAWDGDGDYHIQMTASPTSGNHCLIVELPMDDPQFESDVAERARCTNLRAFLRKKLLHDVETEPVAGGNWMKSECYMSVTGQLFFDDWHVGGAARGRQPKSKSGVPHPGHAATLWEIHPITNIKFATAPQ